MRERHSLVLNFELYDDLDYAILLDSVNSLCGATLHCCLHLGSRIIGVQ